MRGVLLTAAFVFAVFSASAQPAPQSSPAPVERVTRGNLQVENVPVTPPEVAERLTQYVNTRAASFLDWTPDGGMLIATNFGESAQIHHVAMPMGARTQLTFYTDRVTGGQMVPHANTIVYARDRGGDENFGGYLFDPANGRATLFTAPGTRNTNIRLSRDGKLAAWAQEPLDSGNYDIYVGDPANPSSRHRVLQGQGAVAPLDFSPDGSKLLVGRSISIAESQRFILDIASGQMTRLTPDLTVAYEGGKFMPDGRSVLFLSDEGAQFPGIVQLDLATGARTKLTPGLHWDVEDFELSEDGATIAYVVNEAGVSTLHLMDAHTHAALAGPTLPAGVISNLGFDHAGHSLAFTLNSATAPGDVYSWDLAAHRLTRWTQSETGGLPQSAFVAPRLVSWRTFDGRAITGFLYEPRTPGPHPLIVNIHGGPEGQSRPTFSSTIQYWVNELGVSVILPNVRGSTGYGKDFLALDNGEKREDTVRDIGALLDWVGTQPQSFDKSRVMVYGGSYGGYMVLACMTHFNDRLAGGVDVVGISNWITFFAHTSGYRADLRRVEYGDERIPRMHDFLQRISPITSVHNITKPMFIVAGFNDPRVPHTEGEQMTAAIRANGGEVWFMMGMNEGHGFAHRDNQTAQREAETLFFRHVLNLH